MYAPCVGRGLPMHPLLMLLVLSMASYARADSTVPLSTTMDSATASTSGVTPPPLLLPPTLAAATLAASEESIKEVGTDDARLLWLPWSSWSCNCPAGAMSRVREVSYQLSGIGLSAEDFNRKRFQRVVCDYQECQCNRNLGQCDSERADCPNGEDYQCALRDLSYAESHPSAPREGISLSSDPIFWDHISGEVATIWNKIKKTFRSRKHQAAGKRNSKAKTKATRKSQQSTSNK